MKRSEVIDEIARLLMWEDVFTPQTARILGATILKKQVEMGLLPPVHNLENLPGIQDNSWEQESYAGLNILPCPKCKNEYNGIVGNYATRTNFQVHCFLADCLHVGPNARNDDPEEAIREAITLWNKDRG